MNSRLFEHIGAEIFGMANRSSFDSIRKIESSLYLSGILYLIFLYLSYFIHFLDCELFEFFDAILLLHKHTHIHYELYLFIMYGNKFLYIFCVFLDGK